MTASIEQYTQAGAFVFATLPNQKHNGASGGYHNSFNTRDGLSQWLNEHPDHQGGGIGLDLDKSSFVVVDIDKHDSNGINSLESWLKSKGMTIEQATQGAYIELTPSGGYHIIFKRQQDIPLQSKTGILTGVDIKASGAITVAPTKLNSGDYKQLSIINISDVQGAPGWVYELANYQAPQAKGMQSTGTSRAGEIFAQLINGVGEGGRNQFIAQLSGYLLSSRADVQASAQDIYNFVLSMNESYISPPLSESEVYNTFNSIYRKEKKRRERQNQL